MDEERPIINACCLTCDQIVWFGTSDVADLLAIHDGEHAHALLLCESCQYFADQCRKAGERRWDVLAFRLAMRRYFLEAEKGFDNIPDDLFVTIYQGVLDIASRDDKSDWQKLHAETDKLEFRYWYGDEAEEAAANGQ
jgi:hypothetical protein